MENQSFDRTELKNIAANNSETPNETVNLDVNIHNLFTRLDSLTFDLAAKESKLYNTLTKYESLANDLDSFNKCQAECKKLMSEENILKKKIKELKNLN